MLIELLRETARAHPPTARGCIITSMVRVGPAATVRPLTEVPTATPLVLSLRAKFIAIVFRRLLSSLFIDARTGPAMKERPTERMRYHCLPFGSLEVAMPAVSTVTHVVVLTAPSPVIVMEQDVEGR